MTSINRYIYSGDKQITSQIVDEIDNFLWVAFAQNTSGECIIEKQSKFSPTQTYFSLEREVDKIISFHLDSNNIYVAYIDDILLGEIISKNNPLTSTTQIFKGSILESPIDVKIDGNDLWFLLPGSASGTNAQLLRYNTSGILQQTVDLSKTGSIVTEAKTMTIDDNSDIWIGTYTDPARVVRVFDTGGNIYDFEITEII